MSTVRYRGDHLLVLSELFVRDTKLLGPVRGQQVRSPVKARWERRAADAPPDALAPASIAPSVHRSSPSTPTFPSPTQAPTPPPPSPAPPTSPPPPLSPALSTSTRTLARPKAQVPHTRHP